MKKILSYFVATIGLMILLISPTQASTYFAPIQFFYNPASEEIYESRYEKFGGCEEGLIYCYIPVGSRYDVMDTPYIRIDAIDGIKKGIYSVEGPGPVVDKGKFIFKYTYNYNTQEDADDVAIVKIKKVATNEIVYYQEYTENSDGPQDVRVLLPIKYLSHQLQLVFEVDGKEEEGTHPIFYIDNVSARATSAARISGQVTDADGAVIEGARIYLKLRAKNKNEINILKNTTTDSEGKFYFYPVRKNRRYTLIVKYNGERYAKKINEKIERGQDKVINFQFN